MLLFRPLYVNSRYLYVNAHFVRATSNLTSPCSSLITLHSPLLPSAAQAPVQLYHSAQLLPVHIGQVQLGL